jgi:caa(3)-type oxidase subunit IV
MDPTASPTTPAPPAPHAPHARPSYVGIWVALAVLTAIELGVAFLPWTKGTIITILIVLAFWKALLVALYYMHLRFERLPVRILALAPLPFVIVLFSLALLERFE